MPPRWTRTLVAAAAVVFSTTWLHAQAGTAFSYQAYVEFDGSALNEPADFRFTLWNAPSAGDQVGDDVRIADEDVVNGLLSVELDFGLESFETGKDRWLQVEMRAPAGAGAFETLDPRQLVAAVPGALHALSGTPGPAGPQGPAGDSLLAGQLCPASQTAIGIALDGTLLCARADACAGVQCQAHQNCELLPGPGGNEVGICVDSCQNFDCPAGSACELRSVACVTAPCPPVAVCTMMPTDPQDPCASVRCGEGQECKLFEADGERVPYCADTCVGRQCATNEICELQQVACVRAPCPPVARCVADPGDPCDRITCGDDQECRLFDPGSGEQVAFCADTCAGVACPDREHCELVDVLCVREPCPPIAQCVPDQTGDACGLPIDRGPCRALIPRWGHDSESGRCERFNWGGCGGNANNYSTLAECERACAPQDACALPADPGACNALLPRWYHDDVDGRCERFVYGGCGGNDNNFQSQAACEMACRPEPTGQCDLAADPGPCRAFIPRWHHDSATGQCEEFIWGGCGGNDNNYATRAECERTCDVEVNACGQAAESGPCRAAIPQWHHDPSTGQCEKFTYGGCGGNDNRYSTRAACERACDVQVDVCAQPADSGPCRAYFPRWFNDDTTGQCARFVYGGCGGNDNNFESQGECREACGSPVDVCDLPSDTGRCDGAFERWFHDTDSGQCEQFTYGGCEGNGNNFASRAECEQSCEVQSPGVCALPAAPGPCKAYIPRWRHDPDSNSCERFIYGGCGGNGNNFTSLTECEQACRPSGGGD